MSEQQTTTLEALRGPRVNEANLPAVHPGFGSLQAYELLYRQAKTLSSSTLVPTQYRQVIVKTDRNGNVTSTTENANAIPNTMIALNMAMRMNADPVMVMQNLIIVEGRPSWSAQWVIAQINNCGRFVPLRFDLRERGEETVEMEYTEWKDGPNGRRISERKTKTVKAMNIECVAWTVERGVIIPPGVGSDLGKAIAMGVPVLKGPKVSVAMAIKEGWYSKTGSKWQTMPELMLHYRSGAFFGRLYAPELLMGIPTDEEVRDMGTLVQAADGSYGAPEQQTTPTVDELRKTAHAHADAADHENTSGGQQQAEKTEAKDTTGDSQKQDTAAPATEPQQETAATASTASDSLFGNTD